MTNDKQQAQLGRATTKAIARSHDLLDRTRSLPGMPTPEQRAADEFAAQAIKAILAPAPDGLNVFEELAKRYRLDPSRRSD